MTAPPMVKARRVLRYVDRPVREGDEIVTAFRDGQVTLRSLRRSDGFTNADKEVGYHGVEPGDLVVHAMDGFAGAIGVSDSRGKMSPVAHTWRAVAGDERYVAYVLRSFAWSGRIASLAKGIRERSTSFDPATLLDLDLPWPPVNEQVEVADFLDEQVARLDEAAAVAAQLPQLADLQFEARLGQCLDANASATVPVKALTNRITSGPRGWGDLVTPEGSVFLRIGNLPKRGLNIDEREIQRVTVPAGAERERTRTRPGDVLVSITATLGDVGVVRDDWTRDANVSQHVALLRPRDNCSPDWLAWALQSPRSRSALSSSGYGGTKVGLGLAELANHRLPARPLDEQRRQADDVSAAFEKTVLTARTSGSLVALLTERKRALITACVTREFSVSAASSRAGDAALAQLPAAQGVLAE